MVLTLNLLQLLILPLLYIEKDAAGRLAMGWGSTGTTWPNPFTHVSSHDGELVRGTETAFADGGGVACPCPIKIDAVEEARGGLSDGNWLWSR